MKFTLSHLAPGLIFAAVLTFCFGYPARSKIKVLNGPLENVFVSRPPLSSVMSETSDSKDHIILIISYLELAGLSWPCL